MSPAATAKAAPKPQTGVVWETGMVGIDSGHDNRWFHVHSLQTTTVLGTEMEILWGRDMGRATLDGAKIAIAKNATDLSKLRVLGADEAHKAFEEALAALSTPTRYKTVRGPEYKRTIDNLRVPLQYPNPVDIAKALGAATHYLRISRKNAGDRAGSYDLMTAQQDLFTCFLRMMYAVYGPAADQASERVREFIFDSVPAADAVNDPDFDAPEDEADADVEAEAETPAPAVVVADDTPKGKKGKEAPAPKKLEVSLKRKDVILSNHTVKPAPKTAPVVKLVPAAVAGPADGKPLQADIDFAKTHISDEKLVARAAETFSRGTFVSWVNLLTPSVERRSLAGLSEHLGLTAEDTRPHLQEARDFISEGERVKKRASEDVLLRQQALAEQRAAAKKKPVRTPRAKKQKAAQAPKKEKPANAGTPAKAPSLPKEPRAAQPMAGKDRLANAVPLETLDLGWFAIDRYDFKRGSCVIRGTDISVRPVTFAMLKILAAAKGKNVPYATLQDVFPQNISYLSMAVSQCLGDFDNAYVRARVALAANPVMANAPENILERAAREGVRLLPAPEAQQPEPEPVKPETIAAAPAEKGKPTIQHKFRESALPAHLDTGDFKIDYEAGRHKPARINGTDVGLSAKHYGILVDLFNQRGKPIAAAKVGQKYFPDHQRPSGTAFAAIFTIRKAFEDAHVKDAGELVVNVQGEGHMYRAAETAPRANGPK